MVSPDSRVNPARRQAETPLSLLFRLARPAQIARALNISEGTIKCHLHAIYTKLRIQSRFELLAMFDRDRSG
jgi:DNA-binding CsgD family transcriptional regulator